MVCPEPRVTGSGPMLHHLGSEARILHFLRTISADCKKGRKEEAEEGLREQQSVQIIHQLPRHVRKGHNTRDTKRKN